MKEYPERPTPRQPDLLMDNIRKTIEGVLEEELPECDINQWFIESIHFSNMLDKVMEEIWKL